MSGPTRPGTGLRVLLLVDSLGLGGAERLMVPLARGLRARGIDARVMHLGSRDGNPLAADLRAAGVPVLDLRLRSLLDPRPPLALAGYLRRERIDLVHTHLRYADLLGRVAGVLARRPVISTVHTIVETQSDWRASLRRQLDELTARVCCARLIAVSEAQRHELLRRTRIDPEQIEVHRNGVETERFRPDPVARGQVRRELALATEAPLYVTVAVLRAGKGIEHLLAAAARVRAASPEARLVIVGDGPERPRLEARVPALGLGGMVRFLGARADVHRLLAGADVYVHPSLFEALPTSVLEAMATELPVVATEVGGSRELITDGETGLLVAPASPEALAAAMLRLLDPALRARLGTAGRAWVDAHASTRVWLDGIEHLYRRVVQVEDERRTTGGVSRPGWAGSLRVPVRARAARERAGRGAGDGLRT